LFFDVVNSEDDDQIAFRRGKRKVTQPAAGNEARRRAVVPLKDAGRAAGQLGGLHGITRIDAAVR